MLSLIVKTMMTMTIMMIVTNYWQLTYQMMPIMMEMVIIMIMKTIMSIMKKMKKMIIIVIVTNYWGLTYQLSQLFPPQGFLLRTAEIWSLSASASITSSSPSSSPSSSLSSSPSSKSSSEAAGEKDMVFYSYFSTFKTFKCNQMTWKS